MFEAVDVAPPDPILGLTEAFKADTNPNKINLGVGVYKAADGTTPVLPSVKAAEKLILEQESTKAYLPINGDPTYGAKVREMLFGAGSALIGDGRAVTAHTPGGTGALRVAGDYLKAKHPDATLWMSDPTWANHPAIYTQAGIKLDKYPYFDAANNAVAFDQMLDGLKKIPAGDAVLLHACCHNPTGADLTPDQFGQVGALLSERKVLPIVDFAYQGFADGLEQDAAGLRALAAKCSEYMVCSSYSKNFGLYRERTGALTVVAGTADAAQAVLSHIKVVVRRNYSNPPSHGGAIVLAVLQSKELSAQWEAEVTEMRSRVNGMRKLFADTLKAKGAQRDFQFIVQQRGMFSFSGLNQDQVQTLRAKHSIYIVGSGRINVAGMTEANMPGLCDAIVSVL